MKKNMGKRLLSVMMASAMMMGVLSGCGDSADAPSGDTAGAGGASSKPLVVGVQSSIISLPTVYAKEKGYFDDLGLDVELVIFPNGSPENEGLAAEQLDIASNGLASVFSMASGLCAWVGETDTIGDSTWLFARPDNAVFAHQGEIAEHPDMYGSADTLKGQQILGPTSTIQQHMAAAYMNQFGLTAGKDYEFLNMDNSAAAQAFLAGEGDMIGVSDFSFVEQMEKAGMKKVASYQDATGGEFLNGILARYDVLEERRADVVLFLKGMYKAAEELQSNPDVRKEFAYNFYNDNGKTTSEEALDQEIASRTYVTPSYMQADDYVLGYGMVGTGEFFASIGTIEESQVDNVKNAIDGSLIKDALDIEVKTAG
ncbi:ABC transporter substrate-binding protein [Butyricicoccus faecihominis]|uniref:ABC transporter substrate-binding protein n=1 Tax=Butyricicoccus faecihominis TaxID=1712515 RepID=UPI0024796DC7|nr:ABC transporter substrate-binding protein [Butyricicoccus faecihominis]MCQ5129049.1 ABC transporter substrate-binding protein [Butyricicoccus faecihominis]